MKKRLISLCLAVILSASLLAIPAGAASGGATTTAALNLRASAGTDAKLLLTMPQGAKVIVHSTSNGWSKVTYNGTDGYASADYLSASSTVSSDFGTGTITGSDVRMRSGPGTSHSILGTYPKGTQMKVTGVEDNWYAVNYDGKDGYVSSDFMKVTSSTASSSSTSQTTSSSGTSGKGKVTGSSVNMRSGAGTSYSVLATFAKGTEVEVTGKTGNWYAIRHNGKPGYISADYLSVTSSTTSTASTTTTSSSSADTGKTGSVIGTSVRMRSGPGTNYDTLGYYSNGVTMTVLGSENGWYKVSYNGKTGYIIAQYFRVNPESTGTTEGEIRGSDVNMRLGPGTNYGIVATYQKGTKLNISGTSGDWYEVSVNGKYGYIKKDFVKVSSSSEDEPEDVPAPTQTMSETGIIRGTSVRMRGGPGTNYAVVGYLNNGTKVSVTGKTGNWYAIKYNGTKGYVSADYVSISSSSSQASQVIATAKEFLGTPYVYGGTSPSGFDCSGLIYYVFKQYGYSLYRCADDMYYHDGFEVSKSDLQPGDLVFFSSASYPVGHVGMYIGNNQFIHASSGSGKVVITNLTGVQYYETHYVGAKRVLK